MPNIASTRETLGVKANRTGPDGKPYHTLPVIHDHTTSALLGDSFEIALYLDKAYPTALPLFRPNTVGLTAAFNAQVDGLFTKYVILADSMPFDPDYKDEIMGIFIDRAKTMGVANMQLSAEMREATFVAFEKALGEFMKAYYHVGGTTDYFWQQSGTQISEVESAGPWLDGEGPVYADLIVGAWLAMCNSSMKKEDWERVAGWHNGFWARLHDALAPWREMK